jgi:NADH-quinone oxidoreductase subunit L
MGGLRKYMPWTWGTFLVGSLALIGTPFFAGFYSKDSIIEAVRASHLPGAGFAYFAVAAGVFVTAFYSFRLYFLVFHGEERFRHKPFAPEPQDDHAAHDAPEGHGADAHASHAEPGAHGDEHHDPRESPWVVTLPLVLLAIPSAFVGLLTIEPMLFGKFFDGAIVVFNDQHPAMQELGKDFHGWFEMAVQSLAAPIVWLALAGVVMSWYFYLRRPDIPAALQRRFSFIYKLLDNKYYFDWFNEMVLARAARMLGTALWKGGDVGFIDGVVIDGSASTIGSIARAARLLQSGYLYWYALVMIIGVIGLMTWQLWPFFGSFFGR